MSRWIGCVTNTGDDLIARALNGEKISICKATFGTGTVSAEELKEQTSLVNEKQEASIMANNAVEGGRRIGVQVRGHTEEYKANQIGFWGKAGEDGELTLVCLYQYEEGVDIPAASQTPDFLYTFYGIVSLKNDAEITVVIDPSNCVTMEAMEKAMQGFYDEFDGRFEDYKAELDKSVQEAEEAAKNAVRCGLTITFDEGFKGKEYTVTDGQDETYTGTVPEELEAFVNCHMPSTTYTVKAQGSNGHDYAVKVVTGPYFGMQSVHLEMFAATLEVTAVDGAEVTATCGDETATGRAEEGGKVTLQLYKSGTWEVTAEYSGATSNDASVEVDSNGGQYTAEVAFITLAVTVESGSTITVSKGETSIEKESTGDPVTFWLPELGEWTVKAEKDGDTAEDTVTVEEYKAYEVTITYFTATLTVTAEKDAVVTASADGGESYEDTVKDGGTVEFTITKAGTYTVKATKEGATSSQETVDVNEKGHSYSAEVTFPTITVTATAGSNAALECEGTQLTGLVTLGSRKWYLPKLGTWKVTVTLNEETAEGTVEATEYKGYEIKLDYVKIWGVCWNYGAESTALTRLKKDDDPNNLVTAEVSEEPQAAVGSSVGSSPFDTCMPWSGMEEYNITPEGVKTKSGTEGFSRTEKDVMVYIPTFYFAVKDVSNEKKRYFYIADGAKDGVTLHPGSNCYVGRYHISSGYVSISAKAPLVNITRKTAREESAKKGTGWQIEDFAAWAAQCLLYLVEYADFNCQEKIGKGYSNSSNSGAINTGGTDAMAYHTGRPDGTDDKVPVQYRHIEAPWGTIYRWIDGVNFNDGKVYVCLDPSKFKDDTNENYTEIGTKAQSNGYIKALGMSEEMPWAFYPSETGGSETTYVPDYAYYSSGWRVLHVGGGWNDGSYCGWWYFGASGGSSYSNSYLGARLLYRDP